MIARAIARAALRAAQGPGNGDGASATVASFFEHGVCFRIECFTLEQPAGGPPRVPIDVAAALEPWAALATHVLVSFTSGEELSWSDPRVLGAERFAHVLRVDAGGQRFRFCAPAHQPYALVGLLHRHREEVLGIVAGRYGPGAASWAAAAVAAHAFLLTRASGAFMVRSLVGYRERWLRRAGVRGPWRRLALVRSGLSRWLRAQDPADLDTIDARTGRRFAAAQPVAAIAGIEDARGDIAALERGPASVTLQRLARVLEAIARDELPGSEARMLLPRVTEELSLLQVGSHADHFFYAAWRTVRGALRISRFDDRVDIAANRRVLRALDALAARRSLHELH